MLGADEYRCLSDPDRAPQRAYWLKKLAGQLPEPNWFVHGVKSAHGANEPGRHVFELPEPVARTLLKVAGGSDLSVYLILLATLNLLQYKYGRGGDVMVLSPAFRPGAPNGEADLVPLRTTIAGNSTFKELLRSVKQTALEAYSNQDMSHAGIARLLDLSPGTGRPVFSNVTILLEGIHDKRVVESDLNDLTFSFAARPAHVCCELIYDRQVIGEEKIARIAAQYVVALASALNALDATIASISVLTPDESRLMDGLNDTCRPYPDDLSVARLFEEQAARTPHRIAAIFEDHSVSYSVLSETADRLARRLRDLEAGPESVVALLGTRRVDYLAAILGVFKAGAAYLPLDPAHPVDRLSQILSSAKVRLAVTTGQYREKLDRVIDTLAADARPEVIFIEDISLEAIGGSEVTPAGCPLHNSGSNSGLGTSLSYVFYTSGSTGIPKGAMIELAGMQNHLFAKIDDLGLTGCDVVAQNASQCFDISVWQFVAVLLVGGTVRIISDDCNRDVMALLNEVAASGLTVLEVVPSQLRAMLDALAIDDSSAMELPALRCLVATGEALPPDVCRQWIARYPNKPIVNAWGPTETSDDVTHFHVNEIDDDAVSVPIGRTLGNMAAFVLDGDLSPVPLETPGEIYAGGICVGRGYLGDPEKTAANFRPDPFSRLPGARAYKTGDLGRLTADCHIDFLGRIDHQVKVRGYRIELGEVEAAIAQHPDVHEVSILAREGQPGEKRLVAYIVLKQGTDLSVSALRDSLREKLPDYMVPSAVIVLQSLPRTANGKLDRKSLPAPDSSRPELEEDFVPASTPVEKVLAEIWSQVLGVKSVGVHDNFFELGGDSIQCIQIVARARQAGLQIAPNQIFQFQTIGELAAEVVSAARATTAAQGLVTGLVPLTPIQRWFFELDFANPNFHNQVLALEARDPLNHSVMRKAIAVLLSHHDALRLRFSRSGDQWSQTGGHPEDATPFSVMDLSDVIQSEQERRVRQIAEELSASIRLDGPVFNSMLFDLGAGRPNILVLVAHHLVVDGVSWRIVHEDLQTAYEQLANGDPAALPPKTNSYKEWAERLFDYAQSPAIELEAGFWTESLNSEHLDRLPLDHPEGDNCVASTRFVSAELDSEETQALLRDVTRDCQARVNELLLAALLSATFTWTGQSHVMIDLEGHGRSAIFEDLDLTRTVGWFTSIYPVLFECGRDLRPEDLVKSVMKQARQVPKDGVGFGLLRYLNGNPGVATAFRRMPCPEISFNYLGQLGAALPTDQILSWQSISLASDPNRPRTCVLEINAVVSAGRLRLSIGYSENLHDEATIRRVAGNYMAFLKGLIDYTRFADDGITSASRFPEANLSDEQLAQVVALLG